MSWDMEALLLAVRDRLKSQVTALGNRVFVVGDEALLPPEPRTPLATVMDGGTNPLTIDVVEILAEHDIVVALFVENLRDVEAPVLGDAAGTPGIQDLTAAMLTALKDQTLGLSVLDGVRPVAITGTELFAEQRPGGRAVIRKAVTWRYIQKPSF